MKCSNCETVNIEGAKFCRRCGLELVKNTVNVMDKYPKYNFVPTSLMKWKRPVTARIGSACFFFVFFILLISFILGIYCLFYYETKYYHYEPSDEYECIIQSNSFQSGSYGDRYNTKAEAFKEATSSYYERAMVSLYIVGAFMLIAGAISYGLNKKFPSKKTAPLREVADYIQNYWYTGLFRYQKTPKLKFFVKQGKFGLMDVANYTPFLPAKYDFLAWREKEEYLIAKQNDREFIIDIYGKELK